MDSTNWCSLHSRRQQHKSRYSQKTGAEEAWSHGLSV